MKWVLSKVFVITKRLILRWWVTYSRLLIFTAVSQPPLALSFAHRPTYLLHCFPNCSPLPQVQSIGIRTAATYTCSHALPRSIIRPSVSWVAKISARAGPETESNTHSLTNKYFILREWVHQLQWPGGGIDHGNRGSGCWDTGWWARIKGSGCGLFRIDELGVPRWLWWWAVILEDALQTVWSDWPPCFTLASDARCLLIPLVVVGAKWACDVLPAGNRHETLDLSKGERNNNDFISLCGENDQIPNSSKYIPNSPSWKITLGCHGNCIHGNVISKFRKWQPLKHRILAMVDRIWLLDIISAQGQQGFFHWRENSQPISKVFIQIRGGSSWLGELPLQPELPWIHAQRTLACVKGYPII
jgi:hypothetical protein